MTEEKPPKVIITVLLVNGERIDHTLDVPSDYGEARKFVKFWVNIIGEALTRGKARFLWFPNPSICYNPDNVLGVEFKPIEAEQLEEAVRKAQRRAIGYMKE